jgi:hypothetical protein
MAQRLALGMTLPSAAEQEAARVRLLAYAAGYISDPGDDDDTWFISDPEGWEPDDESDPPYVRCYEPA